MSKSTPRTARRAARGNSVSGRTSSGRLWRPGLADERKPPRNLARRDRIDLDVHFPEPEPHRQRRTVRGVLDQLLEHGFVQWIAVRVHEPGSQAVEVAVVHDADAV